MIILTTLLFLSGFFSLVFGIIWLILIIIAVMDLLKSSLPMNTKLLWLIVILIAPVLGSLLYLLWGKGQRI